MLLYYTPITITSEIAMYELFNCLLSFSLRSILFAVPLKKSFLFVGFDYIDIIVMLHASIMNISFCLIASLNSV